MKPGVFYAETKNKMPYYRASITFRGKHISLGSYIEEAEAGKAYLLAGKVLADSSHYGIDSYPSPCVLSFQKWVVLINLRDNHIYIRNPIFIRKHFFLYYMDQNTPLKFDADDLFYFARHKILKRGGHLFTSEYGMQVSLLSRYTVKNYAVPGRDYRFVNGDPNDFRYSNIEVINRYYGVTKVTEKGRSYYRAKIHVNGDYLIGRYQTEEEAAIAFNKAAALLREKGMKKNYPTNYIEGMDGIAYAAAYQRIRISGKLIELAVE